MPCGPTDPMVVNVDILCGWMAPVVVKVAMPCGRTIPVVVSVGLAAIVVFWLVVRLGRRTLTILVVGLGMEPIGLMVISWELATVVVTFKAAIGFNKVRGALVPPSSDVATVVTITGLACPPRLSSQRGAR